MFVFFAVMTFGFASCETDKSEDAYEIDAIDKEDVRSPDDRDRG